MQREGSDRQRSFAQMRSKLPMRFPICPQQAREKIDAAA
jgi:hypothetical protein